MRSAIVAFGALVLGAGCGLPTGGFDGQIANTCSRSSDCPTGSVCLQAGVCASTSFDLVGLVLQVRPDSESTFGGGSAFLVDPASSVDLLSKPGNAQGMSARFDIKLTKPISIRGAKVVLDPSTDVGTCVFPADRSVAANVTFYRVPKLTGMPFDPVTTSTKLVDDMSGYAFDVDIVDDTHDAYDVYIEPQVPAGCSLALPPYFLPGQTIDASRTLWQLPPIGTLSGTIAGLSDSNWEVDLVEPTRGLPISAGSTLSVDTSTNPPPPGTFTAQFAPVAPGQASAILRLSPIVASGSTAMPDPTRPTIYWSLEGAVTGGTKSNPVVSLKSDLVTNTVKVGGQILGTDGVTGIPSQLLIHSDVLLGDGGGNANASFSLAHLTDGPAPGQYQVPLPPGIYWFRAVPIAQNGLSITDKQITVPMIPQKGDCVCALSFDLDAKGTLSGWVTTASGDAVTNVSLALTPSQGPPLSYLKMTHSLPPLMPRAVTTTTDGSGSFSMLVDQGSSDFTVQPDPGTNLPWLVVPQITPVLDSQPTQRLLKNPVFLSGTVLDPQGAPVANAQIDAWYPVRQDPNQPASATGTVVKIATASTDASGTYTLVLPSSI